MHPFDMVFNICLLIVGICLGIMSYSIYITYQLNIIAQDQYICTFIPKNNFNPTDIDLQNIQHI
jgi:hypothetical protein